MCLKYQWYCLFCFQIFQSIHLPAVQSRLYDHCSYVLCIYIKESYLQKRQLRVVTQALSRHEWRQNSFRGAAVSVVSLIQICIYPPGTELLYSEYIMREGTLIRNRRNMIAIWMKPLLLLQNKNWTNLRLESNYFVLTCFNDWYDSFIVLLFIFVLVWPKEMWFNIISNSCFIDVEMRNAEPFAEGQSYFGNQLSQQHWFLSILWEHWSHSVLMKGVYNFWWFLLQPSLCQIPIYWYSPESI